MAEREAGEEVTRRMAMRLQTLWQELKIPNPDRAYITAKYLEAGRGSTGGGRYGSRGGFPDGFDGEGGGGKGEVAGGGGGGGGGNGGLTGDDVHRELTRQIRLLLEHRAATVKVTVPLYGVLILHTGFFNVLIAFATASFTRRWVG